MPTFLLKKRLIDWWHAFSILIIAPWIDQWHGSAVTPPDHPPPVKKQFSLIRSFTFNSSTLLVPSIRRATLGDRVFPMAAARAWNSLPAQTGIPASNQGLSFPSVIQLMEVYHCPFSRWRTKPEHVFIYLCKVPPQLFVMASPKSWHL